MTIAIVQIRLVIEQTQSIELGCIKRLTVCVTDVNDISNRAACCGEECFTFLSKLTLKRVEKKSHEE